MSPKKYKKLIKLRKNLDILDNSFIKLIKKRTRLVNQVLDLKEYCPLFFVTWFKSKRI